MKLATQRLYIGGKYVPASSQATFATINPATGATLCDVEKANDQDITAAIRSAHAGFAEWSQMTGTQRGRILNKAVSLLRQRNDELAHLEVLDTGKPIQEASVVDVHSGADCLEYYAGLAASIGGRHLQLQSAFVYTRREPLGICVGIGAWNYPLQIACWKSAPALACGNVMIYKPSELTPLTALKLAEIYTEAGLPNGVFNVVQGDAETGKTLTMHPDVAKISLTGEVNTGKSVMAAAAKTLKHLTLELGGKSPLLIFSDADLKNAVSAALLANFYTQGEICSNGTRVFVQEEIKDEFLKRLKARLDKLHIGDPIDPKTHIGSLISTAHMEKVLGYIEIGKQEGAHLFYGGSRVTKKGLHQGCFVEPTVFTECHDNMRIFKEEIFGPVMSVSTFKTEEEVIARANDTLFGLAAGVFTQNLSRAHRVIAKIQAGTCWINNYNITPIGMPFGGYKQSGIGRENGLAAIEYYTQLKSVYVELGDVVSPYK